MHTVGFNEFTAYCSHFINEIARTGEPFTIMRSGKPIAQLQPVMLNQKPKTLRGALKGWVDATSFSTASSEEDWSAINGEEDNLYEDLARYKRTVVAPRKPSKPRRKSS